MSLYVKGPLYKDTPSYLRLLVSGLVAPRLQQICFHISYGNFTTEWDQMLEVDRILEGQAFSSLCCIFLLSEVPAWLELSDGYV
jgi:hypothetical protein